MKRTARDPQRLWCISIRYPRPWLTLTSLDFSLPIPNICFGRAITWNALRLTLSAQVTTIAYLSISGVTVSTTAQSDRTRENVRATLVQGSTDVAVPRCAYTPVTSVTAFLSVRRTTTSCCVTWSVQRVVRATGRPFSARSHSTSTSTLTSVFWKHVLLAWSLLTSPT